MNKDVHIFDWSVMDSQGVGGYLECLRLMIRDLHKLNIPRVEEILDKYNVYELHIDKYARVNLDFPLRKGEEDGV